MKNENKCLKRKDKAMSYVMKTNLANRANYGQQRLLSRIKYIVIHYTANDGDSDESNANYFHNKVVKASAHYFVDDDSITQTVPDDYVAYAVGGNKWNDCAKTGGGKLYGIANNTNSISIEMCDTVKDGKILATETTMTNTAELTKILMKKYNVDIDHVIRHFDVNGKHCPAYLMDEMAWSKFKKRLCSVTEPVTPNPSTTFSAYKVKVETASLNIRKGPGTNYGSNGQVSKNQVYTIVEESSGKGSTKGWGKLKSGAGWISLDFVSKV